MRLTNSDKSLWLVSSPWSRWRGQSVSPGWWGDSYPWDDESYWRLGKCSGLTAVLPGTERQADKTPWKKSELGQLTTSKNVCSVTEVKTTIIDVFVHLGAAEQIVNLTQTPYEVELAAYLHTQHSRTTLTFFCSHVCDHLINVRIIFTPCLALLWFSSTPVKNLSLKYKQIHYCSNIQVEFNLLIYLFIYLLYLQYWNNQKDRK